MQEFILIISRCLSKGKSINAENHFYRFHFKGHYAGAKVSSVVVYCSKDENLSKGDDYLLWVKKRSVDKMVLEVELVKYKKIG